MNARILVLYAALSPSMALLLGCTATMPTLEPVPTIQESRVFLSLAESNQLFLEQAVDNLNLPGVLRNKIPTGSSVVLVSMETSTTLDAPIVALIEDQLIRSLVANDFHVRERDEHIVRRMIQERLAGSYVMLSESTSAQYALERQNEQSEVWPHFIRTQLPSADFLVSYRILELGIVFPPTGPTNTELGRSGETCKRQGLVRLHVRVQDAKTGEILFSDNLQGMKEEEISANMKYHLEKRTFRYTLFPYDYPLQSKP